MIRNPLTDADRLTRIRWYRRAMFGAVIAGTLGFVVAETAGYPLVGVAAYWLGFAVYLAVWRGTDTALFDERDREIERRAVTLTVVLFAFAGVLLWPAVLVLSETRGYDPPPEFAGFLLTLAAQALVFGVVYLWLRHRP